MSINKSVATTLNRPRRPLLIIVPVYKSVELAELCLSTLFANLLEIADLEPRVLAINDSPDDASVCALLRQMSRKHGALAIRTNAVNLGFVKTVNRGLEVALCEGNDVLLVNADTETYPGTLRKLADIAHADPLVGFVCPRSNNASICSLPHTGGDVTLPNESLARWRLLSKTLPDVHYTPTGVGFYLYIKHQILANFGFLREDFGLGYEEENDLILRANKAGYRVALANKAFAYHAGSASFKLTDLDLDSHRLANLRKMSALHPEFLGLIWRYTSSPTFRAEALLGGLLPSPEGKIRIVFDLSQIGKHHNGTNELSFNVLRLLAERHADEFELSVYCPPDFYAHHRIDLLGEINLETEIIRGKHAISVRFGQPFDQHHISVLEDLAPLTVYGMLDTIAEDCGHLSINYQLRHYWAHVANHASGVFFISRFSQQAFATRFPANGSPPLAYTKLLPTKLKDYRRRCEVVAGEHVLILGNHFPHKASDSTAALLSSAFPAMKFVVLGSKDFTHENLRGLRAGMISAKEMDRLFSRAKAVVLPSHVEGFGFGLLHALAARKPVVARRIEATLEIVETFSACEGLHLYDDDSQVEDALERALRDTQSGVDDSSAEGWEDWVDGFAAFLHDLRHQPDIFSRVRERLYQSDLHRKAYFWDQQEAARQAG